MVIYNQQFVIFALEEGVILPIVYTKLVSGPLCDGAPSYLLFLFSNQTSS